MADKDHLIGCRKNDHDDWHNDCASCLMNKDVYENYSAYQAMAEV